MTIPAWANLWPEMSVTLRCLPLNGSPVWLLHILPYDVIREIALGIFFIWARILKAFIVVKLGRSDMGGLISAGALITHMLFVIQLKRFCLLVVEEEECN